ncbi:MAG: chitobiase/beta-hexosaminidase C-terminal domain-containing protein [Verrucomicrobiota bacterium]
MRVPAVGSYGLRILSPTLLELTLVTLKQPDPATLTEWNFVANNVFTAPATSEFAVTAGNQTIAVQSVGFKRRADYATTLIRDLRVGNHLYLKLANPIADGQTVEVKNPSGQLWAATRQFIAESDPLRWSPAIHVNQEGYMPDYVKKASVSYYIGNLGEMSIPSAGGFKILDAKSGAVVFTGALTLRRDIGYTFAPAPYQQVYEADFTSFQTPGEYRLQVAGLGASFSFLIDEGLAGVFARSYALGLYHQRCGYENDYPFSRHTKGVCHNGLVEIPDMTFSAVNTELSQMTRDYAGSQTGAPQLKDVNSSLYPFVNKTSLNLRGGHHDAGDYSKYTINVAQLAHSLVFAADSHAGVAGLDNLGLPESGDGKSDVMQEAKWELDYLAKLQDADGGFYFLVYPRNREYEGNVSLQGTDLGDSQVVFPKTTAATAASVAALAQAASSPLFRQYYPEEAADYLVKARKGWVFLKNAWARYGREGAYQKITHYGNEFRDRDEIAWAACELFLATGEQQYHTELLNTVDPSSTALRRWNWWRLFEGYGCAIRSYAFAARSGRLPASQLNAAFLAKCEAEIIAAGDDQVRYSQVNAFGNSFPDANKPYRTAGWFFSVDQTYDLATAYQLSAKQSYLDTIIANMNYEAGLNPLNTAFLTGIGWKRQHITVNQYAENDRRDLPPSGIPLGSVTSGAPYLYVYQNEMSALGFPGDNATSDPYAPYDKWTDTFHTGTEMVNPQQGHSLAAMAFMMARTSATSQPWRSAEGTVDGLPSSVPAEEPISITLTAPGIDLSNASIVWEGRGLVPTSAQTLTFSAANSGPQWLEAEALLPDGRRIFVRTNFNATAALNMPANSYQSAPVDLTGDMVALYHLDSDFSDATGKQAPLTLRGATLDADNLGWMANRSGAALHSINIGEKAVVASIPNSQLYSTNTTAIEVEAMIYISALNGYAVANSPLISLVKNWNSSLELFEDKYAGIKFRGGTQWDQSGTTVANALSKNSWHHLRMVIDQTGYSAFVDGNLITSKASTDFANWNSTSGVSTLTLGNFDGWVDEVVIRNVRPGGGPNSIVATPVISPVGGTFLNNVSVALSTVTAGATIHYTTDGTTPTAGSTVYANPFTLSTTTTVKAVATKPGMSESAVASATFLNGGDLSTNVTLAAPTVSPGSGTFSNSVAVTLATAAGATIRYTLDGSVPTASSTAYSSPITVSTNTMVRAFSALAGYADSASLSANYTIISNATQSTGSATRVLFVKTDTNTIGNWKGVYGGEGYNVIGNANVYPSYAQVTFSGKTDWLWANSSSEARCLVKAGTATDRIAASAQSTTSFTVDIALSDTNSHRVAMYFLDWDRNARVQTVEVRDATSGAVLDTQTVAPFQEGKYLVWEISGSVKVRLTRVGGYNATLQGLFFDSAIPAANKPTSFVKADTTTKGTWKGIYGADGYNVIGNSTSYPAYAQVSVVGKSDWTWTASTTSDLRCLQKAGTATDRIGASWQATTNFTVSVNITDGKTHQLAMYFMDFDRNNRSQQVELLEAASGAVIDSQTLSAFQEGKYLVWNINTNVKVRITWLAGYNATLQGIFFDTAAGTGSVVPSGLQMKAPKRTSNGQFQIDISGPAGQQFMIQASTDLSNWTTLSTNTIGSSTFSFVDSTPASTGMRFYRAVQVP